MGCDWAFRRCAARRLSEYGGCRPKSTLHHRELRRRLLRVFGYGDGAASSNPALLRNVRAASYPRTRSPVALADSYEDWLQAGQVPDGFESDEPVGKSRLLGRSGLRVVLRFVATRPVGC